jgi:hypothetical protein
MTEVGNVAPIGRKRLELLLEIIDQDEDGRLPEVSRSYLRMLVGRFSMAKAHIIELDGATVADVHRNEGVKRLTAIPSERFFQQTVKASVNQGRKQTLEITCGAQRSTPAKICTTTDKSSH